MKNKNDDFGKLKLNKLKISSMEKVVGGRLPVTSPIGWYTDKCNSSSEVCNSRNTAFTGVVSCCEACAPSHMKC